MMDSSSLVDGPLVQPVGRNREDQPADANLRARPGESHRELFPLPLCTPWMLTAILGRKQLICRHVNIVVKSLYRLAGHTESLVEAPDDMQLNV